MAEFHNQCYLVPYLRIVVDDDPSQHGPGPMNLVDMGLSQAIVGRATHSMVSTFNCFNERDVRGIQQDSSRFSFVPFRQTTTHTHTHLPSSVPMEALWLPEEIKTQEGPEHDQCKRCASQRQPTTPR